MALKATIHKAQLHLADLDRSIYTDHALTIARHPSETDERMMVRLLAYALNAPADSDHGGLELAKSLWDTDEPDLWQKDLTGRVLHWIDVGQPDDKRLMKACGRAGRVTVLSYSASTPLWWSAIKPKLNRARNLAVWRLPPEQSAGLGALAERSMQLQVTVQDGQVRVDNAATSVEIDPQRLLPA